MFSESETRGLIFSISRASGEDGPGIRTTLFMKGCPLRCLWCHSPQSQGPPQPRLVFYQNRCVLCGACSEACPRGALQSGALRQEALQSGALQQGVQTRRADTRATQTKGAESASGKARRILWDRCDHCGRCAEVCPSRALEMAGEWLTVDQVMDVVRRDAIYYEHSGGGITFSGGEPTAQPYFLEACAQQCRDEGFHTALDTCGYAEWPVLKKILPHIDLILFDLKHTDGRKHEHFTGVNNDVIHGNLRRIDDSAKPIWIRIPLIPGYNDSEENLQRIAEMVRPLKAVKKVSILPYNSAAGARYGMIGRVYDLEEVHQLEGRESEIMKIFSATNKQVELGR